MKNLQYILLAIMALSLTFSACDEEKPFETIAAEDEPRILDPIFANSQNGELPLIAEINRDANLTMELTVTPSAFSTITWWVDGDEINEGPAIDFNLEAGTYHFKVIVTTEIGKSSHREGIVRVNPLPSDPWITTKSFENIIVPGTTALFYGDNLSEVKSIVIDGETISDFTFVEDVEGDYIQYMVSNDFAEGTHRVLLVDEEGEEYGANTVTVTSSALVTGGANRVSPSSEWRLTGLNMDQIASLTLAGETITTFSEQTSTELVLTSPNFEDGIYELTGQTSSNSAVQFFSNGQIKNSYEVTFSSETILFEGHHYVSWEFEDDNPNKTFNLIGKEVFAALSAGTTLSIQYSIESADVGHQLQTTSGWWALLPGTEALILTESGGVDVLLTQEVLNMIQEQDGFLCVGHGYYVDRVTLK